ncbi:acyltransferase [Aeromonas salmonicida subsp. pectinolytica]
MKDKLCRIFIEELWSIYQFIFLFIPGRLGHRSRGIMLGYGFKKCGRGVSIKENVEIYQPWNLCLGDKSGFGRNNIIDCTGGVDIGSNVRFGPNVVIATMNHATRGGVIGQDEKKKARVVIGDNCWVGAHAVILPGVEIGNDCIIAAGSVVTKRVPSGRTVAGVPAREI